MDFKKYESYETKSLNSPFPVINVCCPRSTLSHAGSCLMTPIVLTTFLCRKNSAYIYNNDCNPTAFKLSRRIFVYAFFIQ